MIEFGGAPCQNTATTVYVNGWTVTADVQRFVTGTQTNFGWMIRDDAENVAPTDNARFATRELATSSRVPQLTISWTP